MNNDITTKCEKSFYQELYHFDDSKQELMFDQTTGKVLLKKTLEIYDTGVYQWIRENPNVHIPSVHSFWEEDGRLILLEEYVQGETLEKLLEKVGLSAKVRRKILLEICDALIFLHSAPSPIIHRDIKSSNVMITSDGVVKLIDYDAAKTYHEGKNVDTTLIGTVGSAAPEQYGFAQSDERTDIYSLGVLIREIMSDSPEYQPVIIKSTQMEPKLRYQKVTEMKRAIENISSGKQCNSPKGRGGGTLAGIILVAFIAVAAAGVYFWMKNASRIKPAPERIPSEASAVSDKYDDEASMDIENTDIADAEVRKDTNSKTVIRREKSSDEDKSDAVVISESCWRISKGSGSSEAFVHYGVILTNNTDDKAAELPAVNVTAKKSDGTVLGTDNMVGSCIMPHDSIALSSLFSIPGDAGDDIEVSFELEKADFTGADLDSHPRNSDFTVSGISEQRFDLFPKVTGEIISHYSEDIDSVAVTALFRKNGKLVDAETTYVDDIRTGKARAFEISLYDDIVDHDSFEISVQEW